LSKDSDDCIRVADVMLILRHWPATLLHWLRKIKLRMNFEKYVWRNFRYFYKLVRNLLHYSYFLLVIFAACVYVCMLIIIVKHQFLRRRKSNSRAPTFEMNGQERNPSEIVSS